MKRLIKSKITFPDPYVIKAKIIEPYFGSPINGLEFYPVLQRSKKLFANTTWGYSDPEYEFRYVSKTDYVTLPIHNNILQDSNQEYLSYWIFKEKQDALQFLMLYGNYSTHVYMWDKRLRFTIIEQDD